MPNLTRGQKREREANQLAKRKMAADFLNTVLPRDAEKWKQRVDEVCVAFAAAATAVRSSQPGLPQTAFLMALQSEALRQRWKAATAELFNLKFPNFGSNLQKYLDRPKPRRRGEVEQVWEYWFQPMNLHLYCRATNLGQTQIKRWLSEISGRDTFVVPAPKERGKGREKNYTWEVNREILGRWLLLKRHTREQRRGFLHALLVSEAIDAENLMHLVEFVGGSDKLLSALEFGDLEQLDQFAADSVALSNERLEAKAQSLDAELEARERRRAADSKEFQYQLARELAEPPKVSVTNSKKRRVSAVSESRV